MGKLVLVMPHDSIHAHPQLIPTLERRYSVDVYMEGRLNPTRLQAVWQRRHLHGLIIFGSLVSAGQLAGLPPRQFGLIFVNLPFALPDSVGREPMCAVINAVAGQLDVQLWGQAEQYVELLCQLVLGLYSNLNIDLDNVNFTEKEKEVLRMVLQGLKDDYIGRVLFISPKTVRNHISNMLKKVRVDSRTQLVLWALKKHYKV